VDPDSQTSESQNLINNSANYDAQNDAEKLIKTDADKEIKVGQEKQDQL
jgi:hypothetical protein